MTIKQIFKKYKIYTLAEAAKQMGVNVEGLRRRCQQGKVEAMRVGRDWLVMVPANMNRPTPIALPANKSAVQLMKRYENLSCKEASLLLALCYMWNQYCADTGHKFMSAGENARDTLAEYGIVVDDLGGEIDVSELEEIV